MDYARFDSMEDPGRLSFTISVLRQCRAGTLKRFGIARPEDLVPSIRADFQGSQNRVSNIIA